MSNSYSISNCVYDGSAGGSGDPNPLCTIYGTVNTKPVFPAVFFNYLMAANAAGGSSMQLALTAIMFSWFAAVYGYLQTPWPSPIPFPSFSPSSVSATQTTGPFPNPPVVVSQALIGSWNV
jgi:hypothetical protein